MGRHKALIEIEGEVIVARLARVMLRAGLSPVVVVAHGEVLEVAHSLDGVTAIEGDASQPMIDSVARGVDAAAAAAAAELAGAVVQPVDAPFTDEAMIALLLEQRCACALSFEGTPGHPVYVPRALFDVIRARGAGGLRAVLAAAGVVQVAWRDARVLADVDTPADLAAVWGVR